MGRDNLNNIEDNGLNAEPYGEINFKKSRKRKKDEKYTIYYDYNYSISFMWWSNGFLYDR